MLVDQTNQSQNAIATHPATRILRNPYMDVLFNFRSLLRRQTDVNVFTTENLQVSAFSGFCGFSRRVASCFDYKTTDCICKHAFSWRKQFVRPCR